MTDTEKAALERRIDELCAEVERLRQQNATLRELENIRTSQVKFCEDLDAENAKLRQENQSIGMAAYEVGYGDGSIHYEFEHCPACQNIADLQEALEDNAKLREYAAKAWSLFIRHGAVHTCDLSEVDAVRDGLRELGIEVDS